MERTAMRTAMATALAAALLAAACEASDGAPAATEPVLGATVQVVPGPGLPADLPLQDANNNLDATTHEGRVYLAFRTAPNHFASPDAVIHVVSSADQVAWRHEASFTRGTDLREPRLMSWNGHLFLYFAVLGQDLTEFKPQGFMVTRREPQGTWTEPAWAYEPGLMVWRSRVIDGTPYLVAYEGGEALYSGEVAPEVKVHWLTTRDGLQWEPVVPGQPVVLVGGVSETDFALLRDGTVVSVSRDEEGDADGWGSKICRAEKGAWGTWTCRMDPRKFDSPLVFRHGDDVWLLGRRNLSETGHYDLFQRDKSHNAQTTAYQIDFWAWPKRCSLWRVLPDTLAVEFVADLPSRGDTCFPALVQEGPDAYRVYNYTSPLDGPDLNWIDGQLGPTNIVSTVLTFVAPDDAADASARASQ